MYKKLLEEHISMSFFNYYGEVEYGRRQEANAVREKISQILQNTEYKPMTDNIIKFFSDNKKENSKKLYAGTLNKLLS